MSLLLTCAVVAGTLGAICLTGEGLLADGDGCTVGWRARHLTAAVLCAGGALLAMYLLTALERGAAA